MEIFNKQIFGSDADEFMKLTTCQKKEWIKKHTNAKDDQQILEFIKNATKGKDCQCLDCGKEKKNGNISKGNEPQTTDGGQQGMVAESSGADSIKRQSPKRRKNK